MKNRIKHILKSNQNISLLVAFLYTYIFGCNKIKGTRWNNIQIKNSYLRRSFINIRGKENEIFLGHRCVLNKCLIHVDGNNNKVILGENVAALECEIHIEDNNNTVRIGSGTHISGKTHLACIEGTNIKIGKNCLFSCDITFRTGDSHTILNLEGDRINPSKDIEVGDHVWIGNKTIITKGAVISENSIIATGAIVTNTFEEGNVILGGVPAKIIKRKINWDEQRF